MSYIMDTIFGDGSEGSGTPDALKTVGSFVNAGIALGAIEVISNAVAGGVNVGGNAGPAPAAAANLNFSAPSA